MMDLFKYSLKNVATRKMRSVLTTLSIVIGIASIFAILSFGLGLQSYINELATEAGTDKFFIQARGMGAPGTDDSFSISEQDLEIVSGVSEVEEIAGLYMKVAEIEYDDETIYKFIAGVDPDKLDLIEEAFTIDLLEGRRLREGQKSKVVLGYNYREKLFDEPVYEGDKINIQGKRFDVVGFYEEIGNAQDDEMVYMTHAAMEELDPEIKYSYVIGKAKENVDMDKIAETIEEELRDAKGIEEGEEEFYVQTFSDALETFRTIIDVLNAILFLIAFISMIVAFVNIMNTMYTAVIERTNEIGIMKAIGARNSSILIIFLFESAFLGFIGGLLGIGLGYVIASIGGGFAASAGYALLSPVFPPALIIGCIAFATGVGALAGVLPARQAANQNPVDALRCEE
ncbi:MAG: ABC transporter permease [Candidatus Woesearchaeota archaeon]